MYFPILCSDLNMSSPVGDLDMSRYILGTPSTGIEPWSAPLGSQFKELLEYVRILLVWNILSYELLDTKIP